MNDSPALLAALRKEIENAPQADRPAAIAQTFALAIEQALTLLQSPAGARSPEADRWITAEEVAALTGFCEAQILNNKDAFGVVDTGFRSIRFSYLKLQKIMERKRYGTVPKTGT